jgi:hypothetical protein
LALAASISSQFQKALGMLEVLEAAIAFSLTALKERPGGG